MILKVGASTETGSLKKSITENIKTHKQVYVDCIGDKANYIATRAIIFAKMQMPENRTIDASPTLVILDTPRGERRGIRWIVKEKKHETV